MAPSEGPGGDPAAEEGPTSVTRSSRSGPTTTRYLGDRPAAATRAGECDADGVEEEEAVARRSYYPNPAPRRSTPAAGEGGSRSLGKRVLSGKEAVPRCGCYGDTPPRRPRPFGEGTSAAGAEAAVLTCGCYGDTPPRRPRPFGEGTSAAGAEAAVLTCGCYRDAPPRRPRPFDVQIGSEMDATFCIPVVAGGRGDGGGRGDRDGYIYGCTARPHTFMPAPTSDLAPKDKATSQTIECMEEGYLAKIVPANAPEKAPKANAVQLSNVKSADPDGLVLKADIEDYSASVAKGGKCESSAASGLDCTSFAASGLDCTDIPNAQIRKVTANCLLASKQTIPQYYLTVETRADELIKLRGELNPLQEAAGGKKISKDLVIKDADKKRLGTLGEEVKQLAQRARDNSLKPQDYEGGTFTQSNLGGPFGIRQFPAILNPPQPAILAIGSASVAKGGKCKSFAASGLDCTDIPNAQIRKNDKKIPPEIRDECIKFGSVDNDKVSGLNVKSMLGEIDSSELPEGIDGSFICSDKGGSLGSNKRTFKDHYITKMNLYLRAGSMNDDMLVSDGEESYSYSLRFEELKDFKNFSNNAKGLRHLRQKIDCDYYTKILVKFCGPSIPVRKNLNKLSANMLIEHVCGCAGVRPTDLYLTYCGRILEPNQVLSYYQLKKDSTVYINSRLRGGRLLTIDFETWDDKMKDCPRDQTVVLHPDLIGLENTKWKVNTVTYLSESLQYLVKQVLIGMCRKHFVGISFGGDFTSEHLLFDHGIFRFDDCIPIDEYSRRSALKDYERLSEIFEKAFRAGNKPYPMHAGHLINFLARTPALVDPQSEDVIAYLSNHYSLLSHSQRIKMSEVLDTLRKMLVGIDFLNFKCAIGKISWVDRIEEITAMRVVFYHHAEWDKFGNLIYIPYVDNDNASLLRFSDNFFKHAPYPLQQLEAAFSLAMKTENFMPNLLYACMIDFRNVVELAGPMGVKYCCSADVEDFIKEVISMLGKNTLCCKRSDEASTS